MFESNNNTKWISAERPTDIFVSFFFFIPTAEFKDPSFTSQLATYNNPKKQQAIVKCPFPRAFTPSRQSRDELCVSLLSLTDSHFKTHRKMHQHLAMSTSLLSLQAYGAEGN